DRPSSAGPGHPRQGERHAYGLGPQHDRRPRVRRPRITAARTDRARGRRAGGRGGHRGPDTGHHPRSAALDRRRRLWRGSSPRAHSGPQPRSGLHWSRIRPGRLG
ncbi:MAG: hypothetical protein AVDCRST_MAG11-4097, partial [uncultured Gemmatimonadaceae bacterium]